MLQGKLIMKNTWRRKKIFKMIQQNNKAESILTEEKFKGDSDFKFQNQNLFLFKESPKTKIYFKKRRDAIRVVYLVINYAADLGSDLFPCPFSKERDAKNQSLDYAFGFK